jgi:uncharacterized protein
MQRHYETKSWWMDGLHVGTSLIHGQGVFTSRSIEAGAAVIRWGGTVFTGADLRAGRVQQHTYVGIGRDLYLGNPKDGEPGLDDFMNHSCNGNLWMSDEVTLIARHDVLAGQELTADYALWLNLPDYRMKTPCNCGSELCRHVITGLDWQLPALQGRYVGHFSPFINELISETPT